MDAEMHKLNQYVDILKYSRDAAEGDFCQLHQKNASLAKVRTVHSLSYPALLPKAALQLCLST